ncbi:hypothetical protein ACHQM5_013307 [Ranunculus cassubicifolius]
MALPSPTLSIPTTTPSLHLQPLRLNSTHFTIKPPNSKTHSLHFTLHQIPISKLHALPSAINNNPQASQTQDYSEDDDEFEEEELPPISSEGSRLYVGNLPYDMTSSQLTEIFSEAGRVASVEIVYDRVTDRSRGFAFVTMQSVDEAKEAIRMYSGAQVGGRSVKVNFPEVPRGGEREMIGPRIRSSYRGFVDSPYKIYAGNLSWNLSSQGLRDAFDEQPGLLSAKVIYERDSGRSRGFGFITFSSMKEAQSALSTMNGVEIGGRPLRLNLAGAVVSTNSNTQPSETKSEIETGDDSGGNSVESTISAY